MIFSTFFICHLPIPYPRLTTSSHFSSILTSTKDTRYLSTPIFVSGVGMLGTYHTKNSSVSLPFQYRFQSGDNARSDIGSHYDRYEFLLSLHTLENFVNLVL